MPMTNVVKALQSRFSRTILPPGVKDQVWTEYLEWLCYANAGMLNRGNVTCLDYAIRQLPDGIPIVEIGSFCGLSTNVIGYLKQRNGKKNPLITCDAWRFEGAIPGALLGDSPVTTHEEYRSFVKESFLRNVGTFSRTDLPHTFEAASGEFFAAWSAGETRTDVFGRAMKLGGSVGLCYIDGDHTLEAALADFRNCDRHLVTGGFVLFDDSGVESRWDVRRVAVEALRSRRYRLTARCPNYLIQKL